MTRSDGESERQLAEDLVGQIRRRPGGFADVAEMVEKSGVGSSKLAELCRRHYHATPSETLERARVKRCRRQLFDSDQPLAEVASDAGFGSSSELEERFRRHYRMSPADFRRLRGAARFEIALPRWFQRHRVLVYLGRDPESLTEQVAAGGRSVRFGLWAAGRPVAVTVSWRGFTARCELDAPRLGERSAADVHGQLLRLLGLVIDPRSFERRRSRQPLLARLVAGRRGLSIPQTATFLDGLVWVVCGQQVSLPVAFALRRRLAEKVGVRVAGGGGLFAPPLADAVAGLEPEELRALGFSRAKADYLSGIAQAVSAGSLSAARLAAASVTRIEAELGAVRGLGPWSVNYLMMRSFGLVDCVPSGDVVLERNLKRFFALDRRPKAAATRQLMKVFAPHRSLATFHLWAL
ncbi:MAG: helix-turn-helix domain-containing protein [Thermoanaerobaculia bacterium]